MLSRRDNISGYLYIYSFIPNKDAEEVTKLLRSPVNDSMRESIDSYRNEG